MADPSDKQDERPIQRRPPSRQGRVQVAVHVTLEVRRALKMLAIEQDATIQHLLCVAINDLFERHGRERIADEDMLPRGGAAQKGSTPPPQKKRR